MCNHLLYFRSSWHLQHAVELEQLWVLWPSGEQASGRHQQPVVSHGQRSAALRCGLGAHPALWDFIHRWLCRVWQLRSLHRWMTCTADLFRWREHSLTLCDLFLENRFDDSNLKKIPSTGTTLHLRSHFDEELTTVFHKLCLTAALIIHSHPVCSLCVRAFAGLPAGLGHVGHLCGRGQNWLRWWKQYVPGSF